MLSQDQKIKANSTFDQLDRVARTNLMHDLRFLTQYKDSRLIELLRDRASKIGAKAESYVPVDFGFEPEVMEVCSKIATTSFDHKRRLIMFGQLPELPKMTAAHLAETFYDLSDGEIIKLSQKVSAIAANCILASGRPTAVVDLITGCPGGGKHRDTFLLREPGAKNEKHLTVNFGGNQSTTFYDQSAEGVWAPIGQGIYYVGAGENGASHSSADKKLGSQRLTAIITPCSYYGAFNYLMFFARGSIEKSAVSFIENNADLLLLSDEKVRKHADTAERLIAGVAKFNSLTYPFSNSHPFQTLHLKYMVEELVDVTARLAQNIPETNLKSNWLFGSFIGSCAASTILSFTEDSPEERMALMGKATALGLFSYEK